LISQARTVRIKINGTMRSGTFRLFMTPLLSELL
jgi:hypothetical protein